MTFKTRGCDERRRLMYLVPQTLAVPRNDSHCVSCRFTYHHCQVRQLSCWLRGDSIDGWILSDRVMIFNKGDVFRAGSAGCPVRIGIHSDEELYNMSMISESDAIRDCHLQCMTVTRQLETVTCSASAALIRPLIILTLHLRYPLRHPLPFQKAPSSSRFNQGSASPSIFLFALSGP